MTEGCVRDFNGIFNLQRIFPPNVVDYRLWAVLNTLGVKCTLTEECLDVVQAWTNLLVPYHEKRRTNNDFIVARKSNVFWTRVFNLIHSVTNVNIFKNALFSDTSDDISKHCCDQEHNFLDDAS